MQGRWSIGLHLLGCVLVFVGTKCTAEVGRVKVVEFANVGADVGAHD